VRSGGFGPPLQLEVALDRRKAVSKAVEFVLDASERAEDLFDLTVQVFVLQARHVH
jgi:hypothetical protein